MNARLTSLDAFRGFTIAAMVLVNNPGDWGNAFALLLHAPWHGWTFTDVIFPFFLFIVGVSMVMSSSRALATGATRGQLLPRMWWRALIIVAIGVGMNLIPQFDFSTVRIPGVLQRIGLASAIAAPIVLLCRSRGILIAMLVLFGVYSALMLGVAVPDSQGVVVAGTLEAGRDFGAYIDRIVFGNHVWAKAKVWDPEGLISTLPAVGSLLAGALVGRTLINTKLDATTRTVWLLLAGFAAICAAGLLENILMPVNKNLWTVTYSVLMTGWALLAFGAFYWLLDVCSDNAIRQRAQTLLKPFTIYGMNALFIFVLSGIVGRLLVFTKIGGVPLKNALYAPFQAFGFSAKISSLFYALTFNAVMFFIAWLMWRRKWFVKV